MTVTEPTTERPAAERKEGRVVAIAGPVVDVEFPRGALPEIHHAVEMDVDVDGHAREVVARSPSRSATAASGPWP